MRAEQHRRQRCWTEDRHDQLQQGFHFAVTLCQRHLGLRLLRYEFPLPHRPSAANVLHQHNAPTMPNALATRKLPMPALAITSLPMDAVMWRRAGVIVSIITTLMAMDTSSETDNVASWDHKLAFPSRPHDKIGS